MLEDFKTLQSESYAEVLKVEILVSLGWLEKTHQKTIKFANKSRRFL
jgi:hypothetical protein